MSALTEPNHEKDESESENEAIDLADSLPPLQDRIVALYLEDYHGFASCLFKTSTTNTYDHDRSKESSIDEVLRKLNEDSRSDWVNNVGLITSHVDISDVKRRFDFAPNNMQNNPSTEGSEAGSSHHSNNNGESSLFNQRISNWPENCSNGRRNSKIPITATQKESHATGVSTNESYLEKNKIKYGHIQSRIDAPRGGANILSKKTQSNNDKLEVQDSSRIESKRKRFSHRAQVTSPTSSTSIRESQLALTSSEDLDQKEKDVKLVKAKSKLQKSFSSYDNCSLFQDTKSTVKSYIKGESSPMAPNLVKQVSADATELQYKHVPTQLPDLSVKPTLSVKETTASRKRVEKLQLEIQKQLELQDATLYMTPLQRKELEVKELRRKLAESLFLIEQQTLEVDLLRLQKTHEIEAFGAEKDEQIIDLNSRLLALQSQFETLLEQEALDKSLIHELREANEDWRLKVEESEAKHQANYLLMYKKGRESANFERQDELEKLALDEPNRVTIEELRAKIEKKELELEKWQAVKLSETYSEATRTHTDAEATLKFIRDSVFHYITGTQASSSQQHLRAIIGILQFSPVQMKAIEKSLNDRKKKGKI